MIDPAYERAATTEWNSRNSQLQPALVEDVLFTDVLERFLPRDPSLTCLEVGAIPGRFLVYFRRRFEYAVTGLDFSDSEQVLHETMRLNGITDYRYIKADFLETELHEQFDVVASFGFIEHFRDVRDVVERHCKLVRPDGYLVISVPNFRYIQYVYHKIFDRSNLRIHNTGAMDLALWREIVEAEGFATLFAEPVREFELWREPNVLPPGLRQLDAAIQLATRRLSPRLPRSHWYSPYLLGIFRRHGERLGSRAGDDGLLGQ